MERGLTYKLEELIEQITARRPHPDSLAAAVKTWCLNRKIPTITAYQTMRRLGLVAAATWLRYISSDREFFGTERSG